MRTLIVAGLLCLGCPLIASAQEAVAPNSPLKSFGTTRTPSEFAQCLMPIVQKDFPRSYSGTRNDGVDLRVVGTNPAGDPAVIAVVQVLNTGRVSSLVLIHTESPEAKPGRDIIKAARNCS
ncbi:MAG: hypothetical protein WBW32_02925 [Luteibacter sp.]